MLTAKLLLVYFLQSATLVGINVDTSNIDPEEAFCLAENVYYEAKGESLQGQFAVASVTLNRAKSGRFPNTICEVVRQSVKLKSSNTFVCAFSWYCEADKKGKEIPVKNKDGSINQKVVDQFKVASMVAIKVLAGEVKDNTHGATHFHNPAVSQPIWATEMRLTRRLGNHDFYKP
jgi:N-acetylmuramoyl-L-alanine amidase